MGGRNTNNLNVFLDKEIRLQEMAIATGTGGTGSTNAGVASMFNAAHFCGVVECSSVSCALECQFESEFVLTRSVCEKTTLQDVAATRVQSHSSQRDWSSAMRKDYM